MYRQSQGASSSGDWQAAWKAATEVLAHSSLAALGTWHMVETLVVLVFSHVGSPRPWVPAPSS